MRINFRGDKQFDFHSQPGRQVSGQLCRHEDRAREGALLKVQFFGDFSVFGLSNASSMRRAHRSSCEILPVSKSDEKNHGTV